jgi:S-DNA-T family DNA segregation ATPase FtsK/SpoIIIE
MSKEKKSEKSEKTENTKKTSIFSKINVFFLFFKDEKFLTITGIITLVFSAFLFLSFISYIFTWKDDFSKIDKTFFQLLKNADIVVENWAGKSGALLADYFIHDLFGLASFVIPFVLFVVGLRFMGIKILSLGETLKYSILALIWVSILSGYLFENKLFNLGGNHGYYISMWLNSFVGKTGTLFVLAISFAIFLIVTVKDIITNFKSFFKDIAKQEEIDVPIPAEESPELIVEKVKTDENAEITDEELPNSLDFDVEPTSEDEEIIDGSEEFVVTKNEEEEYVAENAENLEETEDDLELIVDEVPEEEISEEILASTNFDPRLDLSNYKFPPIDLLYDFDTSSSEVSETELQMNKDKIVETLKNYKIDIAKIKATIGPTITLYEIVPAPGVRIAKIKNLEDDIALSLSALGIRIIAPMPGKGTIGIEVPNQNPQIVSMKSVVASKKFQECKFALPVVLGKTITNETFMFDLAKMPHLLVAGATGQGKSVGLNAILASLLYKKHPAELKFVLIDPKKVELTLYSKIEKHFLAKLPDEEEAIITDTTKVINTLNSLCIEMDARYDLLKKAMVRNIIEYNEKFLNRKLNPQKGHKFLPYIVVVIDEFADLIMTAGKEVETPIARIAQLARAIGIHLIIATQRPSVTIITGIIKANFPARIAFRVSSMMDSRTILDTPGANQLIGRGDMLISQGSTLSRVQCAFIDTPELEVVIDYISKQQSYTSAFELPEYVSENSIDAADIDMSKRDGLFDDAARLIVIHQQGSTSLIQRKFSIGYNRAGRIMDQLEAMGIVGPQEGSKARNVLITDENSLEQFLRSLDNR